MSVCMYIYIYTYIYIYGTLDVLWSDMTLYCVEHGNAVTGVDCLNSELPKSSHTSPSRASYGASLWDICTKTTAIHRGCTIYRCLKVPGWNYLIKEYDIYIFFLHLGNCKIFLMYNQCFVPVFYCTCTFWCEIYEHKKLPFKRHLF